MIPQGAHWGFVLSAYGVTALVMAALVAWVVLDGRRHAKALADLEARGIRRRSAKDTVGRHGARNEGARNEGARKEGAA